MNERSVLRAPAEDGAVVADPPLREAGAALAVNRQRLQNHADNRTLLGRPWLDLRRQARAYAPSSRALDYLGESPPSAVHSRGSPIHSSSRDISRSCFIPASGSRTSRSSAWPALTTRPRSTSSSITTRSKRRPCEYPSCRRERGADRTSRPCCFDRWTGEAPYEERTIADRELFASFAERAGELLRGWPYEPLLPSFWAEVLRQSERTLLLGECFAAARRTFERAWGCHNLEVPLSTLCRTEPFAWFACHLLAYLPEFHALYNAVVGAYRRRHGIRGRNHPVPDLAVEGDWLEAPFWGWRAGGSKRGRLFARLQDDRLELRAGEEAWPALPRPEKDVPRRP